KRNLINDLSDNYVNNVFKMAREVNNEILHLKGFLRFQELNGDILFSEIGPKNNILTFIAPHFADRLSNENFIIYDEIRNLCVVHPKYKEWVIVSGDFLSDKELEISSDEELYSNLYKKFCQSIAIKERTNIKLQTQMLPLRFQKYMTEFTSQ
ncbi:MAG: TIGR03915 family putative DNA repair protein, partial [Lachnospiraceae bacterium]|nr:TIGR03915 family putative DNA repair protein [Lachnospiraceae bacterium]